MTGTSEVAAVLPWDPSRYVRKVDAEEVFYSRGFLRCRPERWFPGWAAQWLPLAHSLGSEMRVMDVKPLVGAPTEVHASYAATIDDEVIWISIDRESAQILLDAVSPDATPRAGEVVLEYLARRLFSSLALSWSGPESSVRRFQGEREHPAGGRGSPAVKLTIAVNGRQCVVWISLAEGFARQLDGLWRRQIQSSSKVPFSDGDIHIEVAQLAVPPSMLVDYMRPGTVVDLELAMTDTVTLRHGGRPWLAGRVSDVAGKIAIEVLASPAAVPGLPPGTTRVGIEFGVFRCDAALAAELVQPGAMLDTGLVLSDDVSLVINGERVAAAKLRSYEGRFAIAVV